MGKKIYYVVDLELQHVDGEIQETTGNKTVRVYAIGHNIPLPICTLEIDITDNSEDAIQDYLDDNSEEEDVIYEFIEL